MRRNRGTRETTTAGLTLVKADYKAVNKIFQALRQRVSRLDVRTWLNQVTFEWVTRKNILQIICKEYFCQVNCLATGCSDDYMPWVLLTLSWASWDEALLIYTLSLCKILLFRIFLLDNPLPHVWIKIFVWVCSLSNKTLAALYHIQ